MVRFLRSASAAAWLGLVVVVVVVALLVLTVVNPGRRLGPVDPADPPVGGPGLPAAAAPGGGRRGG